MLTEVVTSTIALVETIADRIRQVRASGVVTSFDAWSKSAHLARQYLTTFLERYERHRAGTLANPPDIGSDAAVALAEAAGLSLIWLLTGIGPMTVESYGDLKPNDPFPARTAALFNPANKGRWSGAARAAVGALKLTASEDPGEAWWMEALDRVDTAIKLSIPRLPVREAKPTVSEDVVRSALKAPKSRTEEAVIRPAAESPRAHTRRGR